MRRIVFLCSWILALFVGAAVWAPTILAGRAAALYSDLLGGKPLPMFTQLFLDIYANPGGYIVVIALVVMATHAFGVHFLIMRARDENAAIWTWMLLASLTLLGLAGYLVLCVASLLLPLCSCLCGMQQPSTPEEIARASREAWTFGAGLLGSVAYAVVLAVLMWRAKFSRED